MIAETALDTQPLTPAGFVALMSLRESSPMSPSELSTQTGYDMGGLTRVVDALERAALVKRERSETDRRAVQIAITVSGLRQTERSLTSIVALLNQIFEPYSRREFETLVSLLQRLTNRLQEYMEVQARQPPAHLTPKLRSARNLPRSQ